jgi:hypothetical protein
MSASVMEFLKIPTIQARQLLFFRQSAADFETPLGLRPVLDSGVGLSMPAQVVGEANSSSCADL